MSTVTYSFLSNLDALLCRFPAVRDGDPAAIHDARVATRRLRAVVPILAGGQPSEAWAEVASTVKATGRALGKVRDTDVALELLEQIERRSPPTAPAAAAMRAQLLPLQWRGQRKLIKQLEALDLDALRSFHPQHDREQRPALVLEGPRHSAGRLAAAVGTYAGALHEAVDHASGVYFPNRAHGVRIALKKLRYAAELVDAGDPVRKPALGAMKRAQEALGQVHDREMLLQRLRDQCEAEEVPSAAVLDRVLEAECRAIYTEYRAARPEILAASQALSEWSRGAATRRTRHRMLAVGAVALPSAALMLLAHRTRRAS